MLKGIDVYNGSGQINWNTVNKDIDFAMIRAGYSLTMDARFQDNISACNRLGIPVGIYWFSYALSKDGVLNEAKRCVEVIKKYKVDFPVAFDWEYESDNYYTIITGYKLSNDLRVEYAKTFLNYIKSAGYIPMLYTNIDYIENKGFDKIKDKYELWLAQYGSSKPKYDCSIWQTNDSGNFDGIKYNVDTDISYKNYNEEPESDINEKSEEVLSAYKEKLIKAINESYSEKYLQIAYDVLNGEYGNDPERTKKLKEKGYDRDYVQAIVNVLVM